MPQYVELHPTPHYWPRIGTIGQAAVYYVDITGAKQGNFKGDAPKGYAGTRVSSWGHYIEMPRDAQTGLATGKRIHYPLVLVSRLTVIAPLIQNALVFNEVLTKVVLKSYSQGAMDQSKSTGVGGTTSLLKEYYTVELANANLTTFESFVHDDGVLYMRYAMTYQKITTTWAAGGITSTDDWLDVQG